MKLIVGLGNPGKEYINTRHNIGFEVIDYFCNKHNISNEKTKFDGKYFECFFGKEKVIFLKPQSYMNLSGRVVKKYIEYFDIDINNLLIISDDLDQIVGKYKLKTDSSSGGHNGLKDIELNLNTQKYKRLKIGISNDKNIITKDYVLGKFSVSDKEKIDKVIEVSSEIILDFLKISFNQLMTKYNKK